MHILLMMAVMIMGLSIGSNVSWFLGVPIFAASLLFLNVGSKAWREKHENFFILFGLGCGVFVMFFS